MNKIMNLLGKIGFYTRLGNFAKVTYADERIQYEDRDGPIGNNGNKEGMNRRKFLGLGGLGIVYAVGFNPAVNFLSRAIEGELDFREGRIKDHLKFLEENQIERDMTMEEFKKAHPDYFNEEPIIQDVEPTNQNEDIDLDKIVGEYDDKITEPRYTFEGKYLRTKRWEKEIRNVERKYNIPENLVFALIMRESYGDPLILNGDNGDPSVRKTKSSKDGGSGLGCLQPGIAVHYGLKTFENARFTGANKKYGKKLEELRKKNNYDLEILRKLHEPFDPEKSIEVIGHFLSDLHKSFLSIGGSWKAAVAAYNCGPSRVRRYLSSEKGFDEVKFFFPTVTRNHVRHVFAYQVDVNKRQGLFSYLK